MKSKKVALAANWNKMDLIFSSDIYIWLYFRFYFDK